MAPTYYKYCITPMCSNTTFTTPEKLFMRVPEEPSRRKQWLKACKRDPASLQSKSRAHVCEDHFNLKEDMKNFLKFKLVGGKLILKANVVPHIFDFQPKRKRTSSQLAMPATITQVNRSGMDDAIASTSFTECTASNETIFTPFTEHVIFQEVSLLPIVAAEEAKKTYRDIGVSVKPHFRSKYVQTRINMKKVNLSPFKLETRDVATSPLKFGSLSSNAQTCSDLSTLNND